MKVLIGQFVTESNANIPHQCEISDYDIAFGEECIQKMQIRDVFDRHGIDLIPASYANAGANGVVGIIILFRKSASLSDPTFPSQFPAILTAI